MTDKPIIQLLNRYKKLSKSDLIGQLADWFNVTGEDEFEYAKSNNIIKQSDHGLWVLNNEESKCPDCGEDVALSGDHSRADVGKKKKKVAKVPRGFEFNETLDDHWKEVEHYLMEDSTNSGQKSDTVGNPEFKAFTHSSSFVGNVLWDRESREMDILLNGNKYHFCNVSERLFDSFEGAGSKGAFFNREIKTLHDC